MLDISIIIVNYNVKEFILNLLSSLKKALINYSNEIIVVDNASQDGSVETIQEKFPEVMLIANQKNVGFGAANNQALEIAKGEYIVLINPDTIVREDTFSTLIKFLKSTKDAGMVGCKVLNPNGTLQLACRRSFPGPWASFTKVSGLSSLFPNSKLFAKYNLTYLDENQTYEVDAISGSFMMWKYDVYKKVGGFDSTFFMYGEDLDLCYRVQKAGYKVYYNHETEIIHYKGESTKRSSIDETKVFYDAMQIFVKKNLSSSWFVQIILQSAIFFRKLLAILNIYKTVFISILLDGVFYSAGVYLAEHIYMNERWNGFPEMYKPLIYIVPGIIQVLISALSGVYKKNSLQILRSFIGLTVGLFTITFLTFFFKQFAISRAVVLITFLLSLFTFAIYRIILKVFFKIGVGENKNVKTIVVGTSLKAVNIASKLKSNPMLLNTISGLATINQKEVGENRAEIPIICSLENIKKTILENKIEKVIFSSDDISFENIFSVVSSCRDLNVDFLVSGEEHDYLVGKSSITVLKDVPLLKVHYNISSITHKLTKSAFDYTFGIFVLIFLYPLMYILSKIANSNSKFVEMVLEVPKVLSGKKSFVGPKAAQFYSGLYLGKPGLTGLWYTDLFDQTDSVEMNKLDLYYAKNQNIWLDIEIIGKTLSKVFI